MNPAPKYLVVGSPVAHSVSPAMMQAAFRAAGIDATYEAREIPAARWPAEMARLHAEGFAGMNVTVPLKTQALAGAAKATDTARRIGAANVLVRRPRGWEADNTDGPGFLEWVQEIEAAASLREEALVLGAGGSARAVVWALLSGGCPRVRVANRTRSRAEALAAELAAAGEEGAGRIVVEESGRAAPRGGLVINCTSLGLGEDDPLPCPIENVRKVARVLDLVYPETRWVHAAREAGVAGEAGLGLLVAQGALSFARWTGVAPDRDAMRRAAQEELARRATS